MLAFHQMPDAADRIAFEHQVTGMQPEQLAQYWTDRRIRGEGGAPRAVTSVDVLHRVVSRRTHAVGYVRWDQIGPELRAIPIDGSLPGDPDYAILADDSAPTAAGRALLDVRGDLAIPC